MAALSYLSSLLPVWAWAIVFVLVAIFTFEVICRRADHEERKRLYAAAPRAAQCWNRFDAYPAPIAAWMMVGKEPVCDPVPAGTDAGVILRQINKAVKRGDLPSRPSRNPYFEGQTVIPRTALLRFAKTGGHPFIVDAPPPSKFRSGSEIPHRIRNL